MIMKFKQVFAVIALASSLGAAAVETVTVTEAGQLAGAITEEQKYTKDIYSLSYHFIQPSYSNSQFCQPSAIFT